MRLRTLVGLIIAISGIACSSGTEPSTVVEGNLAVSGAVRIDSSGARTLVATLTLDNLAATDQRCLVENRARAVLHIATDFDGRQPDSTAF